MSPKKFSTTKPKFIDFKDVTKDTPVKLLEQKFHVDMGVRSDMKLSTYLRQKGHFAMARMLRDSK
jgi:hypothetical protein